MKNTPPDRWSDLRPRVISAAVMVAVGSVDVWLGGWPLLISIAVLMGVMIWELALLSEPDAPNRAIVMGIAAAILLFFDEGWPAWTGWLLIPILPLMFLATKHRERRAILALAALAIMVAGKGLFEMRLTEGIAAILWLIGVVIVSDILGYFIGRTVGGPKFWPSISPKKTWSGTLAGWIGAALVGGVFASLGHGSMLLILLSPLIAFAGQMGDIGESWLKRRAGVKDSSHLIPGHGGFLDRFDALIGATVAVVLLDLFLPFWV
jgi:phosphatidate cytidylyltransferase